MADSISGGLKLSNLSLLVLVSALGVGILLDGTLYNKPVPQRTIYSIGDPSSVEIHYADQLVLGFKKLDNKWQQTTPVAAPAQQQRIQVLLDTNRQGPRKYADADLPINEIFKEPITLKLDNASYQFGTIEPVSKLRYLRANGQVYLQSDTVLPLLNAANNAFIDLTVTDHVQSVTVGDTKLTDPTPWSNLTAIDVTPQAARETGIDSSASLQIQIVQNGRAENLTAFQTDTGVVMTSASGFDYLLGDKTAESLGLTDLLATKKP